MNSDTKFLDCIEFGENSSRYQEDFTNSCFQDHEVQKSIEKLLEPSKKIRRSKNKRVIARRNAEKMAPFFKSWKEARKRNKSLKKRVKYWFSSYNQDQNKTYLYKQISDSVRIHFRLAVRDNGFSFESLKDSDWDTIFLNLTEYLTNEIEKVRGLLLKGKKSQVYPVWIEERDVFTIERLPAEDPSK